jgi:hypothetical protein
MFWPVVAFTGARRTHVDDILRHTRPQALINGHGYWRCIATVWHWEYPVQIACRFLGGICFHLDEDDVGFWRFLTSSIDSCNFGGRVPRPLLVATAASLISINIDSSSQSSCEFTSLHLNIPHIRLNAV